MMSGTVIQNPTGIENLKQAQLLVREARAALKTLPEFGEDGEMIYDSVEGIPDEIRKRHELFKMDIDLRDTISKLKYLIMFFPSVDILSKNTFRDAKSALLGLQSFEVDNKNPGILEPSFLGQENFNNLLGFDTAMKITLSLTELKEGIREEQLS